MSATPPRDVLANLFAAAGKWIKPLLPSPAGAGNGVLLYTAALPEPILLRDPSVRPRGRSVVAIELETSYAITTASVWTALTGIATGPSPVDVPRTAWVVVSRPAYRALVRLDHFIVLRASGIATVGEVVAVNDLHVVAEVGPISLCPPLPPTGGPP